ncbi:unnamed protein product [Callosobruchus maculatus]|uniref:Cytochrome P450 n=1 Tax=Callosobruchus maculatus TaxID=64391 RepID=A0A653C8U1_CALMS|nr:unnamed protein product [Callosobruchus maculatus]
MELNMEFVNVQRCCECERIATFMLLTTSLLLDIAIFLTILLFLVYKYYTRNNDFFKKRGVKHIPPTPFLGNFGEILLLKKHPAVWLKDLYDKFGDVPYFGVYIFDVPYLVIKSPEIVKHVMVKDFHHFMDRSMALARHDDIQPNMMFFQKGEEWKVTRSKMTPAFTSGKLKAMCPMLAANGSRLVTYIKNHYGKMDLEEMSSKYVVDGIFRVFFGMEAHCMDGTNKELTQLLLQLQQPSLKDTISIFCYLYQHHFVDWFKLSFGDDVMKNYCVGAFKEAMKARENSSIRVNDLIDIINDLKKSKEFAQSFDFDGEKVLAQPFQFFIAGHITSTLSLTYTLFELTVNPEVQAKARKVAQEMLNDYGGITYDALMDKKYCYLDMVFDETHRKYPALAYLDRACTADYKIPGTDYVLRKGDRLLIPTLGHNFDEKYFPNPEKYDPERFLDKHNQDGLYFLPFGEGPRACIGGRFAGLNLKVALTNILSNFTLEKIPETPKTITKNPKAFGVSPLERINIMFKPIE